MVANKLKSLGNNLLAFNQKLTEEKFRTSEHGWNGAQVVFAAKTCHFRLPSSPLRGKRGWPAIKVDFQKGDGCSSQPAQNTEFYSPKYVVYLM